MKIRYNIKDLVDLTDETNQVGNTMRLVNQCPNLEYKPEYIYRIMKTAPGRTYFIVIDPKTNNVLFTDGSHSFQGKSVFFKVVK